MPLHLPDRPSEVIDHLKADLTERANGPGFLTARLRGTTPASLGVSTWHRVFELHLDDIQAGRGLPGCAMFRGWRCMVHGQAGAIVAAAGYDLDEAQPQPSLSLTEGRAVDEFVVALEHAERVMADRPERVELSLLQALAVHVSALWLQTGSPEDDRIVPFGLLTTDSVMTKFSVLNPDTFMASVRELASGIPLDSDEDD